jgi:uncharacterized membrane protein HdeD (DUF308 family)
VVYVKEEVVMLALLAGHWRLFLIRGFIATVLGIFVWFWAGVSPFVLAVFFGVYSAVDGLIVLNVAALSEDFHHGRTLVWEAAARIAVAILAFLMCREMNAASDALLIGAWAVLNGIAEVATGVALRRELAGEWPLPAAGAVSFAIGVLLLVRVHTGAMAIAWLMGIYFIVAGCAFMILGAHLRRLAPALAGGRGGTPAR